MNKRGQVGLVEVDTATLPKWLLYPLIILICLVLLSATFFMGIVGYSCIKGNCNGYYGIGWFHPIYPIMQFDSKSCFINGIPSNCSEVIP